MSQAAGLRREVKVRESKVVKEHLNNARVVLATMSGCSKLLKLAPKGRKYTVIIDEAAQASSASAFVPLQFADACIVAGDHQQLAPTVKSPVAQILSESIMKLIYSRFGGILLDVQYRMHPIIMEWASVASYEGRLVADSSVEKTLEGQEDDLLGPMVLCVLSLA